MLVTILGSKGGVGKSTLAGNLLVAARLDGLDAVGLDLDPQGSLAVWAGKRAAAGAEPSARVMTGVVPGWRAVADSAAAPLLVVDTPPGLPDREHRTATAELALASALAVVPALTEGPTLEMLGEVGGTLRDLGAPLVFVLNKVAARKRATPLAREYLSWFAEVSAVEVPAREHIHQAMHGGLTVVEDPRLGGCEAMRALWADVARRTGLA
jgi:chromosome partitioning protein